MSSLPSTEEALTAIDTYVAANEATWDEPDLAFVRVAAGFYQAHYDGAVYTVVRKRAALWVWSVYNQGLLHTETATSKRAAFDECNSYAEFGDTDAADGSDEEE